MKKIYFILLMMIFSVSQAQIITIPDAYLKSKLFTYGATSNSSGTFISLDANGDGQIQVSEAALVYKININNLTDAVTSLSGLNEFPNLTELELTNPDLATYHLIFSNYPNLQKIRFMGGQVGNVTIENCNALNVANLGAHGNIINIQNTNVQEIKLENVNAVNISSTPNLKKFSLFASTLSSLNLSNLPLLEEVSVTENPSLTSINFAGDLALKKLELFRNKLNSLSIPNPSLVNYLVISNNLFQTFDVTPYTGLGFFYAHENQLTSLNFSSNPLLYELQISGNQLSALTFNNNNNLQYIYAGNNQIQNINFNQIPFLKGIQIQNNLFTNIDFSKNFQLLSFDCSDNLNLKTLIMKNGKESFNGSGSACAFANTPQLKYICIDPAEIYAVNALLTQYNQTNVVVNSYCSFTPGGNSYLLQGATRYDYNGNGCDINDVSKPFQKFNILGQATAISDASGFYSLSLTQAVNIIVPVLENPSYFNITPASITTNLSTSATPFTQNFCLTANGTHHDLETVIMPITIARPGFDAKYKIIYKNKGNNTQSGTLAFNYNDNVTDYVTSSLAPNSQSPGMLSWNYISLLPFETKEVTVTFHLNTPTQTPALNGGDILNYTAQINGATDDTPLDNTFTLNQTVVNSFDPNDKTCLEGTTIAQTKVGDYVHYLIRFENTGSANAQNIVVKDDIDNTKYDLSSLVTLNGSHNFTTKITGNAVEFIFENIQLPFDDANNDGYISFKIKTKSTLTAGSSFSNSAKIYFDYNAPITTNTYTTSVQSVLAASEVTNKKNDFSIYPNPVKDILYIQSKEEIIKAEIYDSTGRILSTAGVKNNALNVSDLTKGNYIIKISVKNKTLMLKFIKA
ncbi:putative repeat protein (TIGR01451 family)/predicted secreted protein (Por secretion system target) [Chryseobacterium sp. 52]|uniref:T9SS type A sorting domain-containing protein n=1 Tax=Chryseobacterium sp. 52 TaxID=2035213 RepID=UPI000C356187|nr:T9SS type A sorting domain-containing protein [Chryseobacterium sp. 52]PIF44643.1 putative repeat protein (TIGR01451 family)/predicted secreted protein (Por secretion system target) [Chryseobacterium sp. 52]